MTDKPVVPKIRDVFESRRKFPRLSTDLPIVITTSDGSRVEARFLNISPDGAQIRYGDDVAEKLFSKNISVKEAGSLMLSLRFLLPDQADGEAVEIAVKPVYQHRLEGGEFAMGLFFDSSNEVMNKKIKDYLLHHLEPGMEELRHQFPLENLSAVAAVHEAGRAAAKEEVSIRDPRGDKDTVREARGTAGGNPDLVRELLHIKAMLKDIQEDISNIRQRLDELDRKS